MRYYYHDLYMACVVLTAHQWITHRSTINHLPPVCWSTFWESTFEQPLSCRFDIMDSISSLFCILTYAIASN